MHARFQLIRLAPGPVADRRVRVERPRIAKLRCVTSTVCPGSKRSQPHRFHCTALAAHYCSSHVFAAQGCPLKAPAHRVPKCISIYSGPNLTTDVTVSRARAFLSNLKRGEIRDRKQAERCSVRERTSVLIRVHGARSVGTESDREGREGREGAGAVDVEHHPAPGRRRMLCTAWLLLGPDGSGLGARR